MATGTTVKRGRSYFRNGRVLDCAVDGSSVTALVRGSRGRIYAIELYFTDDFIEVGCSCPYNREVFCKHTIAVQAPGVE